MAVKEEAFSLDTALFLYSASKLYGLFNYRGLPSSFGRGSMAYMVLVGSGAFLETGLRDVPQTWHWDFFLFIDSYLMELELSTHTCSNPCFKSYFKINF